MGTPGFNWRDVVQTGVQALGGAAGNQQLYDQIQQQRDQKKQAADQVTQLKLKNIGQAQQKINDMLASGTHPETGAPLSDMERGNLTQTLQSLQGYAHQIATGQPPPKQSAPPAASNSPGGPPQATQDPQQAVAQYTANVPSNPYAQKYNQIRQAFPDLQPEEAMHMSLGTTPKTMQDRLIAQFEAAGMSPEQALRKYTDLTTKESGKVQSAEPLEKGGVIYGVKDPATGREYLASEMSSPQTPQNVKEIYKTITDAQDQKEGVKRTHEERMAAQFRETQERIERNHDRTAGSIGTWTITEDEDGKPQLFNSKTGETKDAPAGMHKSGYFAKQIAPLQAAEMNIGDYMKNGVFTGPGDLDLQHQYFTATQPATGFRMTKVQQDILAGSQSVMNSWRGKLLHATRGTWFSDEQRQQIADEAQKAIAAKRAALSMAGKKMDQSGGGGGAPSDDDIIKALSGAK